MVFITRDSGRRRLGGSICVSESDDESTAYFYASRANRIIQCLFFVLVAPLKMRRCSLTIEPAAQRRSPRMVHRFYLRCFLRLEGFRDFLPYGTQEESARLVSFTVLLVFVVTLGNQRCLIRSA